ncbi:acetyl-CoA decarbonylase/synthase complex subunit gamma [Thermodesulfobacterium sp. TA1]|uniref:acetyl-CoA decarbonylase/synthase complex subunit gamma n=1 Tax=Thermodesulfobacterium sp. TA1 TaxID=2234087 RepID=UPI001232DE5C|nr:acetyl-CoA decarbonylase/synthase complex subunit gamma [Thermodesulfobacterium sp. TA1]QER42796.1 acetyl-CoA decarbonylase/synthase complex subunit gamma [Thermodesulfobacterium sp. TA1]
MALTGIQIMKLLPKKNCKECGFPTCLAFAMKVAAGQAEIDQCPYVDPKVKEEIAEATAPPIRTVVIGTSETPYKLGGETVLFRHEKKFENPPLIGTYLNTSMEDQEITRRIKAYQQLRWERVGNLLKPEVVCVRDEGNGERFITLIKRVREELPELAIVLDSRDIETVKQAIEACGGSIPLVYPGKVENLSSWGQMALEKKVPLVVSANYLGELVPLVEGLTKQGLKDLVLDSGALHPKELFEDLVIIRRAAIKKRFKPFGFPVITFMDRYTGDLSEQYLLASIFVAKYASIILVSDLKAELLFPLLVERFNLYSDPQKPLVVEEGIYPINGPDAFSPVVVTCNFALTYFIVSGEIEGSRVPCWLLVKDTDGLSVLTAWAAGKFNADNIAEFVKRSGIAEKIKHRTLVIPGYVASIKGELEEELGGWEVVIGPREANGLPTALKELAKKLRS